MASSAQAQRQCDAMASQTTEMEPTHVQTHGSSRSTIRNFRLSTASDGASNGGMTVELSCLGASITKLVMPNYSNDEASSDDVVLSYASPLEQYDEKNSPYFGCIVGRVANRIRNGRFDLVQQRGETVSYQLDRNNGPNHLHGGLDGFGNRIWEGEIVGNTVRFTLISPDGDQGYPSAIRVIAEYSLLRFEAEPGAKLCLTMRASLLPDETTSKSTPIALAQHSYFNLASHSHTVGILDHHLCLPNSEGFTPVDNSLIPTRLVQPVDVGDAKQTKTTCMDFRDAKQIGQALLEYGREKAGLPEDGAADNVARRQAAADGAAHVARVPREGGTDGSNLDGGEPYGFDHNYVLNAKGSNDGEGDRSPTLAAILSHPPTRRCLRVFTTAPGLQLYTSNYLDGTNPVPRLCKEGQFYGQWQGICLETQSFPDSIYRNGKETIPETEKEFARGRCFILKPGGQDYVHTVEYRFGCM